MTSARRRDLLLDVFEKIKDLFGEEIPPPPKLTGWLKGGINTEAMMKVKEELESADHRTQR